MASFNAVNYAKTVAVPSSKIGPGEIKGTILAAYDEYTSLANLGAADIINTGIVVPAGARVKQVTVVSPTNGGTMSVGINGNATKYVSAAPAAAATVTQSFLVTTADEPLIITMGAATAAGLYRIYVEFIKN